MPDFDKLNDPTNHYDGYYSDLGDELTAWYPEEPTDYDDYDEDEE